MDEKRKNWTIFDWRWSKCHTDQTYRADIPTVWLLSLTDRNIVKSTKHCTRQRCVQPQSAGTEESGKKPAGNTCRSLLFILLRFAFFVNKRNYKFCMTPLVITVIICCLLYFASRIGYYLGIVNAVIIFGLTIPPCLAFIFFAIDRRHTIAVVPISILSFDIRSS